MANSSIVRVSNQTKEVLEELAKKSGEPMLNIIDKAIDVYRRRVFLEETNRAYAKLRDDKKASIEHDEEIAMWDTTLMDGLDATVSEAGIKKNATGKKVRNKR